MMYCVRSSVDYYYLCLLLFTMATSGPAASWSCERSEERAESLWSAGGYEMSDGGKE